MALQQLRFPHRVRARFQVGHEEHARCIITAQYARHSFGEQWRHDLVPSVFVGIAGQWRMPIGRHFELRQSALDAHTVVVEINAPNI